MYAHKWSASTTNICIKCRCIYMYTYNMLIYIHTWDTDRYTLELNSVQFGSVTHPYLTLCDPMVCSTPGLPVHHQLLEFTQTHVCWVGDVIQPSHPLLSPSPPASIFPSIRVFSNESALHIRWPKYWSFSFNIIPSNEQWSLGTVLGTPRTDLH